MKKGDVLVKKRLIILFVLFLGLSYSTAFAEKGNVRLAVWDYHSTMFQDLFLDVNTENKTEHQEYLTKYFKDKEQQSMQQINDYQQIYLKQLEQEKQVLLQKDWEEMKKEVKRDIKLEIDADWNEFLQVILSEY